MAGQSKPTDSRYSLFVSANAAAVIRRATVSKCEGVYVFFSNKLKILPLRVRGMQLEILV